MYEKLDDKKVAALLMKGMAARAAHRTYPVKPEDTILVHMLQLEQPAL